MKSFGSFGAVRGTALCLDHRVFSGGCVSHGFCTIKPGLSADLVVVC